MRAAVMRGNRIQIEQMPEPTPGPGQVVLAPRATGICGSDLHVRESYASLPPEATSPIVPGHEVAGEIVAIGPDTVTDLRVGDLATAIPFTHGHTTAETIGLSPDHPGGLAELVAFDAVRTFALPDGLDPRLGALVEPIAVAVHALSLAAPDGPLVVVGAGPIGLAIIVVAEATGRGPIIAIEPSERRRSSAASLGATSTHAPGTPVSELLAEHGVRPSVISPLLDDEPTVATILECVGRPEVVRSVVAEAPPHSRVVLAGACSHPVQVDPLLLTLNEVAVAASFAYRPDEFRRTIELIAARPATFAQLVTSDRPLADTEAAFDDLATDPDQLKILIHPDR